MARDWLNTPAQFNSQIDALIANDPTAPHTITASGSSVALAISDSGSAANSLTVTPSADKSNSSSVGGAVYVNNSGSVGVGIGVYSTNSAPTGNLAFFRANHASFSQRAVRVEHAGTGIGLDINHTGTGIGLQVVASGGATASKHAFAVSLANSGSASSSAGSFVSANTAHSAVQVTGVETGRGTVKIAHVGPGDSSDANASAISIDLQGTSTAAKGIYIVSTTGGTSGALLDVRNTSASDFLFQVQPGQIIHTAPASDPGTTLMWNGSWNAYLNEAGNTLVFKVKYSTGTVKSGTVALA